MKNKEIQRKRMLTYFIEATNDIIESEGMENVTIRKVADRAGYNSATIYNYFENLEHLIFFASMKYFKDYTLGFSDYIKGINDELEIFLKIWELFCIHSFANPKIFFNIFYGKHKDKLKETLTEYYAIFPEEFGEHTEQINYMLKGNNLHERNMVILKPLSDAGIINENEINIVNDIIINTFQSILYNIVILEEKYTVDDLTKSTLDKIKYIITKRHN